MKNTLRKLAVVLGCALMATPVLLQGSVKPQTKTLAEKVRHELVMLPFYNSLFDNLSFQLDGGKVTLLGEVTRPVLKSDAGNVVKLIPGVTSVENRIEVLPLSTFDDQIRLATARAIFRRASLSRYSWGPRPAIHIIVKNGDVILEGVVGNQMDKNLAGMAAGGVFGVFNVTNNLTVAKG
jgi:hyperosmotically inducible periplasmic protein